MVGAPIDIRTGRKAKLFTLETKLFLSRSVASVFPFFADAGNLEKITPPWLKFEVVAPLPVSMSVGRLIDYRLRLHGIPLHWQSEITAWEPPYRFVDEQRIGPYRTWIHEHRFTECDYGCIVEDSVCYAVLGGRLVNYLFVRKDVQRIFRYRARKLQEIFSI
jgi:ligand-binding SRPBCC domain-containing protein